MPLVVPNSAEEEVLEDLLTPALTLKLYSNDVDPNADSAAGDFTEVAGGGYSSKALAIANWGIAPGDPTVAVYNATQTWTFTGATDAPSTVYGYYVTRDSDGALLWAERFPEANVPFTPVNGSIIKVLPRITCEG